MAFLRPEATATLYRGREVIAALAIIAFGGWVGTMGGPFFLGVGALFAATGVGLGIIAWRRLRFARGNGAPGVIEVVEGQITYFGPTEGGAVALAELTEIALVPRAGHRSWRLAQSDGTVLFVPVAATGAEALFDAFAGLPGLATTALLDALDASPAMARIVWRRRLAARPPRRLLRAPWRPRP